MLDEEKFLSDIRLDTINTFDLSMVKKFFHANWLDYNALSQGRRPIINLIYHLFRKDQRIFYFSLSDDFNLADDIISLLKRKNASLSYPENFINWDIDKRPGKANYLVQKSIEYIMNKQLECDVLIIIKSTLNHDQETIAEELIEKISHDFAIEISF